MRDVTFVFDLDGTLVDTAPDLIRCTNHVLRLAGAAPAPPAVLRPVISHGAKAMVAAGLGHHGVSLAPERLDALHESFISHYVETISEESRPFPSLVATLDALLARGARLAVCTNKLQDLSLKLLGELDLAHRFEVIAGRDTFAFSKPDPRHLTGTIRRAGGDPARAIMVGDSDVDIATAKAAGVPIIAVSFGYTSVPVADLSPEALIDHYDSFIEAALQITRRFVR
jgi:phosphoglycolate phosphatase